VVFLPNNLGEIDEIKIAIDSLYVLHRSISTLERVTGINYFKDPHGCIEHAQEILKNLKKKLQDIKPTS